MCDPITIASLAATAIGTVGTVGSAMGQMSAQKKQQREVQNWQQEQKRFREQEGIRQEGLRQEAEKAQQAGVEKLSAEAQKKNQDAEEARLAAYLSGDEGASQSQTPEEGIPVSIADAELSGQSQGGGEFRSDLAAKINEATQGARQRMGALAKVSSFGDSFGGLRNTASEALTKSGRGIDMANEFRRGSLSVFGGEKSIDPVQVTYNPGLTDVFKAVGSLGAQGLGTAYGGGFAKDTSTLFPAAPTSTFIGPPKAVLPKYRGPGLF